MKDFMEDALIEAKKAYKKGEVPIGAVIVLNGKVVSRGCNKREKSQKATDHAEIIAIEKACKKLHSWRLDDAEIYVTLEPCPMCAGAIANARIKKVYYAAEDSTNNREIVEKIFSSTRLNHKVEYIQGTLKEESSTLLSNFFKEKRESKGSHKH